MLPGGGAGDSGGGGSRGGGSTTKTRGFSNMMCCRQFWLFVLLSWLGKSQPQVTAPKI